MDNSQSDTQVVEAFNVSKDDFSYGINVLLGKIIKGSGLKLIKHGVVYEEKLSIETHQSVVGNISIAKTIEVLFDILKMDVNTFKEGFKTEKEMFAFVATTPFLKSSEFTNPRKKHKHPSFESFQEYLLDNDIVTPGMNITHEHIDSCVDFDFFERLDALKEKERVKKETITKFNGRVILDRFPDFDKKVLSKSFGTFKFSFGSIEKYREFILGNSVDVIMDKFLSIANV